MTPKKDTQKSAKSAAATGTKFKGFTDEERVAMKERAQELKAEARVAGVLLTRDEPRVRGELLHEITPRHERTGGQRSEGVVTLGPGRNGPGAHIHVLELNATLVPADAVELSQQWVK